MIRRDEQRVPLRSSAVMLLLAVTPPLMFPHLLPWPYNWSGNDSANYVKYSIPDAAMTSLMGLVAAGIVLVIPVIVQRRLRNSRPLPPQLHPASWLLIGAVLGWQAVFGVLVLLVLWLIGWEILSPESAEAGDPSKQPLIGNEMKRLALPIVVLVHHCLWRQLSELFG